MKLEKAKAKAKRKGKLKLEPEKDRREIQPRLRRFSRASIESFNNLFADYETISGSKLPPLERCGIAIEGTGKSGKTTLAAGNQRLIIAKCYDGHPIVSRARGKIVNCPDLKTLERLNTDLRAIAKREGKDSQYCQVCYDPISTIVRWLCMKYVEKHNLKRCYDSEGHLIPDMKKKLIDSASEIDGYGPWSTIADYIERMLISFGELGWGWIAMVHYQWKAKPDFAGGMEWSPNLPPTTAERIDKITDVTLSTEREDDNYVVRYYSDMTKALGSRVPLTGVCELPNYGEDGTPPAVTSYDYLNSDYEDACREFSQDQSRFKAANKLILQKIKEGKHYG